LEKLKNEQFLKEGYHLEHPVDLEQEFIYIQQNLLAKIEELETANENLKAMNEKLVSSNKELIRENKTLIHVKCECESKISELRNMTNDLDNLLVSSSIATIFFDKDLRIKLFTPEVQKIINIIEIDIGKHLYQITHNLEYGSFLPIAEQVLQTAGTVQCEIKSKEDKWYNMKVMPYKVSDHSIEGVVMTFTDITDIKEFNQRLMLTSSVMEQSPTSICITDGDGKIQFANERFRKQMGMGLQKLSQMNISILYERLSHTTVLEEIWGEMRNGEIWIGDSSYCLEDKQEKWESVKMHPILNEDGTLVNVLRIAEDITEKVKSEDMLKNSEMLSVVGQLAAGIAHEIRNPLTSLKGFLQLMMQTNTYNKEYTEVMLSEFNRLELIISEFLVLARPQAVSFKSLRLEKILEEVYLLLNTQAILNNTQIELDIPDKLPYLYGNEKELKQLFINMVKNGLEAMEEIEGIIRIIVSLENSNLLVKIIDQGKGITKDQLQKMGQPFFTTKEKGTGLGLMISQKIVDNHQGSLTFLSEVGLGTTVELRFPYE